MNKPSLLEDYLEKYSAGKNWHLVSGNIENISQVVVIPAYAEKEMLFSTLLSLAQNHPPSLEYSLILCVINNKSDTPSEQVSNNKTTIEYLDALVRKKVLGKFNSDQTTYPQLLKIADTQLKLSYIDASSQGCEIPLRDGGVGMARKIGMDMALRLLRKSCSEKKLIISLDADTLVQPNYLAAIKNYFTAKIKTAIVAYEHQMPDDYEGQAAICCYEIFLRYWVLGLKYAKSPWAFHSIGSTIVTLTDSYLKVRGMNRREAAEDFYFLNKLAKIGNIDYIRDTCIFPSARSSSRVPFGTGKAVERFLSGKTQEYLLYDPQIFTIISQWLEFMNTALLMHEDEILSYAHKINPALKSFLVDSRFADAWSKIRRNAKEEKTLRHHFHDWFDGFKTFKLIKYLTKTVYPQIDMFEALARIFPLLGIPGSKINTRSKIPRLEEQMELLQYLRKIT
jgi:glycosyltransferase involved in cell wall biosynthesis